MPGMEQNATETITLLTRALAREFRLVPLHTPDLPVFLAVAWPGSDTVTGLKPRLPAGRGLSPVQALVSAGAEAVELRASLAQRHFATLVDLPRDGGLAMTTAIDLSSGTAVPIAAQEVYLDCAATLNEPLVVDANSTGSAAGATRQDATLTALWECIERDAVALWWHGGLPAGALSLDLLDRQRPRLSWWLTCRDRNTLLLDLTTDIGLPVVAAVSSNPDGREVAVGTAARPLFADAALAAVTEMVQTEVAMQEARLAEDAELALWDSHASTVTQLQFQASSRAAPLPADDGDLLKRLTALGHSVLLHDLTLPGDPLPSMRVLVRGLCALGGQIETARFHRLCPQALPPSFPEPY
jgi:ribosomal protein S12 methylthiotransferase accessory factor YcaO